MITRMHRLSGLEAMHDLWERWEQWFAEVEETHSSLPVLVFYRSQQHDHSWVNAAGAVMDAAALMRSSVATPWDVQADLTIRAGYLALRRIATYFQIPFDPHPGPMDATSVDRAMFDRALDVLAVSGVPMVEDRDQAWRDFNGWRVNYDAAAARAREADDGADAVVGPADALRLGDRRAGPRAVAAAEAASPWRRRWPAVEATRPA